MTNLPFDKPGQFYRGNLHTHSTRSDGGLPPAEAIAAYRDHGYDFMALTDHFTENYGFPITDTREFRTNSFTTILGAELHAPRTEVGERWHIVAVGLPLDFTPTTSEETGPQLAARAAASGAFVGIAHPAWLGVSLADALSIDAAHAIEIHNEGHTQDSDRGNGWYLADLLATRGRRLTGYAADDAHFAARPDAFGGWVQVRAATLDPAALLAALRAGHFYASQGPELYDIALAGDQITIACSPARAIYATGRGAVGRYRLGDDLTEAAFPLEPFRARGAGGFVRVTVVDERGKRAWSNPIWLDDETGVASG